MTAAIRILLLEDSKSDAELIEAVLEAEHFAVDIIRVDARDEFVEALRSSNIDLILADFKLPSFDGLSALRLALKYRPELPFIFVSGTLGEEVAIEALKIGATDYVLKARLSRLAPAIQRALREAQERAERRRAEDASRRSEKELLGVVETIPALTFTALPDGRSVWVNRRWVEYTGSSLQESLGKIWQTTIHPDDLGEHERKWQQCLTGGEPFEDEARHRGADGTYRYFLVRAVPFRDDDGAIVKWYGTLTDIEDRKRAERERERLRRLEADLAHMRRIMTMSELAAALAHELKQPIAAAAISAESCANWLRRDVPEIERAKRAAATVNANIVLASTIIDRVRALYSGGSPKREAVDLNEVIREMSSLLIEKASRNAVAIKAVWEPDIPKASGDRVQLQQVLLNLMLNAIDAMSDTGGVLTVAPTTAEDGQLLVSVTDTGKGLPSSAANNLFEAFFTTKPEGTGMGLCISRRIIESHGGQLWASSSAGRGAVFRFTLPSVAAAAKRSVEA